jgi:hypothetical protein
LSASIQEYDPRYFADTALAPGGALNLKCLHIEGLDFKLAAIELLRVINFEGLQKLKLVMCGRIKALLTPAVRRPLALNELEVVGGELHFAKYIGEVLGACRGLERLLLTSMEMHEDIRGYIWSLGDCSLHRHAATLRCLYVNDGLKGRATDWPVLRERGRESLYIGDAFAALAPSCERCGASSQFEHLEELALSLKIRSGEDLLLLRSGEFSKFLVS